MEADLRTLTVAIPAFRCARFLPAAVDSVLHTTAGRILILEDCSGDDTAAVARALAQKAPGRVEVIESPVRRGVAANMNRAVRDYVQTECFAKLDGDDVLIPGFLESAFPFMSRTPRLGVLSGPATRIRPDEMIDFAPDCIARLQEGVAPRVMSGNEALRFILEWRPSPCSSGAIYRKEAYQQIGGFDENIGWGEDWEIWFRFVRRWSVAYYDVPSALYRIHPDSQTETAARQDTLCYAYDNVFRRAAAICQDPELRPWLRRAFLKVARRYFGACRRATLERRCMEESLAFLGNGVRAASRALFLDGIAPRRTPAAQPATPRQEG